MPYIDPIFRDPLNAGRRPVNSGELNYNLTRMLKSGAPDGELVEQMIAECRRYLGDEPRYSHYNDVVGAVVCCVAEYQRRTETEGDVHVEWSDGIRARVLKSIFATLDPYEDKKRVQNGDVL